MEAFSLLLVQVRKEKEWAEVRDRAMERHPPGDTRDSYLGLEPKDDPGSRADRCPFRDEFLREDLPIYSKRNFKL